MFFLSDSQWFQLSVILSPLDCFGIAIDSVLGRLFSLAFLVILGWREKVIPFLCPNAIIYI